ncbi:hypothetical protein BY458DRAFT_503713, partial [Sporodiniella umbellata]
MNVMRYFVFRFVSSLKLIRALQLLFFLAQTLSKKYAYKNTYVYIYMHVCSCCSISFLIA